MYYLKLCLTICFITTTIAILFLFFQIGWKSSSTKPQKTQERPVLLNSNFFLNDQLGRNYPNVVSDPVLDEQSNNYFSTKLDKPLVSNNLYVLIQYYQTTLKSNNISNYTYQDVGMKYTGPIVEGWSPTQSRNVSKYISKQTVIKGLSNECSKGLIDYNLPNIDGELKLLIMQHSSPTHFEARQSSRNTWMKLLRVCLL